MCAVHYRFEIHDFSPVLTTGHVRVGAGEHASATLDQWAFGVTLAGQVHHRHAQGTLLFQAGEAGLIRPGTPQAWSVPDDGGPWENLYCIFTPYPHMLPWLQYPEEAPGLIRLPLNHRGYRRVVRALFRAHRLATRLPSPERAALAMTAIEEALLWCRHAQQAAARPLDERIERALEYLMRNVGNPWLGLADLVRESGMSRARFMALFRRQVGLPPRVYLEEERLRRARQNLETGFLPIKAVAAESGFADPKYFARRFRAFYGCVPSAVRPASPLRSA